MRDLPNPTPTPTADSKHKSFNSDSTKLQVTFENLTKLFHTINEN